MPRTPDTRKMLETYEWLHTAYHAMEVQNKEAVDELEEQLNNDEELQLSLAGFTLSLLDSLYGDNVCGLLRSLRNEVTRDLN